MAKPKKPPMPPPDPERLARAAREIDEIIRERRPLFPRWKDPAIENIRDQIGALLRRVRAASNVNDEQWTEFIAARDLTQERAEEYMRRSEPVPPGAQPPPVLRPERASFVYFVRRGHDGPIKVGSASHVPSRIKGLQCACPEGLVLLATVPASALTERQAHKQFAAHRIRGEWFRPDPEILTYIESLKKGQP